MDTPSQTKESSTTEQLDQLKSQEKIKKSLLWFGIFSIIMLFAGISSGYIVAMDSNFWVNLVLPNYFIWSVVLIAISSLLLYFAKQFIIKSKNKLATTLIAIALILGVLFGYTQVKGFLELSDKGSALNAKIINLEGRYGEYFTMYKNGKEISFDGQSFFWEGEKVSESFLNEVKSFLAPILSVRFKNPESITNYGEYSFKYKNEPLTYSKNRFEINGVGLSPTQKSRLWHFSEAIINNRGDFYIIGEYGKDFSINYKGKPVTYANRKFYRDGQEISAYAFSELSNSSNRSSSFILAFVIIHGLHWIAGIIVLLVLLYKTLKNKYTPTNHIGLKLGSIYWHFLGILWLYLFVFLNFIH